MVRKPIKTTPDKKFYKTQTPVPHWLHSTYTEVTSRMAEASQSQCSGRKIYLILAGWVALIGIAVAAHWPYADERDARATSRPAAAATPATDNAFAPSGRDHAEEKTRGTEQNLCVELLTEPENSIPSVFRHTQENRISQAEQLRPAAAILRSGQRPLRVMQIGDSHVAGKTFPQTLKQTLCKYLGEAEDADSGSGVWFSYFGSNGATTQRFLTPDYMEKFAAKNPDLIILSLGTNEAHGMGYRKDLHEKQLDTFLTQLREACPDATILLTTPPGDYLSTAHVSYRRTSRSRKRKRYVHYTKRPNPMSARCAELLAEYGEANQMPVWNMFDICGGEEAAHRNWVTAHYMRADRIHFEPQGYTVQGKLLGEALARAFGTGC